MSHNAKKKDKKEIEEIREARSSPQCEEKTLDGTHQTEEVKKLVKVFKERKYSIDVSNIGREEDDQAPFCFECGHRMQGKLGNYMCPNCDLGLY